MYLDTIRTEDHYEVLVFKCLYCGHVEEDAAVDDGCKTAPVKLCTNCDADQG